MEGKSQHSPGNRADNDRCSVYNIRKVHMFVLVLFEFIYFVLTVLGIKQLRQAIVEFHQRVEGISGISPDDVIIGPGTKQLSFLLQEIFNGGLYEGTTMLHISMKLLISL